MAQMRADKYCGIDDYSEHLHFFHALFFEFNAITIAVSKADLDFGGNNFGCPETFGFPQNDYFFY